MMWSCTEMPSGVADVDDRFRHLDIGLRMRQIAGGDANLRARAITH
jgi:hypothetical protein